MTASWTASCRVRGISKCLLIISMDSVHDEMLDIIASIKFCPVRLLLHPPRSEEIGRVGGRGSEGVLVIKEHWRWLVGQVFDKIPETRGYEGDAVFMEEDHLPTPGELSAVYLAETSP